MQNQKVGFEVKVLRFSMVQSFSISHGGKLLSNHEQEHIIQNGLVFLHPTSFTSKANFYNYYMMQEMRPEIEAINEEMRNVSMLICSVHIAFYMEFF